VTSNAVKPAPSILAADFAYRGDQVADHQLAEKSEHLPLEALLMISNPVSLSMNLCRPGPIHFWSAGRATIICRACKASKRWENGSASPLTRRLARPFWSRSCKTSRPGAGHDGEPWIRTSALPSRDAPEDQACAPDEPRWCWRSVDVGTNGGVWPWRVVIAMMIGGPETTGHKTRKPNQLHGSADVRVPT
jgi:hypothetical protein